MRHILIGLALLLVNVTAADARPRHRVAAQPGCVETIMIPCYGAARPIRQAASHARRHSGKAQVARHAPARPARHVHVAARPQAPAAVSEPDGPPPPLKAVKAVVAVGDGVVRAASGAVAYVAKHATAAFQCVVTALESAGYRIKEMGGFANRGHIRHSLHYSGLALDVNQIERNVTEPKMPANEIELANGCGLISGAQWANGDSGHFQLGGWSGKLATRHVHRRHYAARRHRHYAAAR